MDFHAIPRAAILSCLPAQLPGGRIIPPQLVVLLECPVHTSITARSTTTAPAGRSSLSTSGKSLKRKTDLLVRCSLMMARHVRVRASGAGARTENDNLRSCFLTQVSRIGQAVLVLTVSTVGAAHSQIAGPAGT